MDRDAIATVPEAAPRETPVKPITHAGAFRALHTPMFRRYFAGQVASASGTFLQQTAIGWLVLQLTGSASASGSCSLPAGCRLCYSGRSVARSPTVSTTVGCCW